MPIGCHSVLKDNEIHVKGLIYNLDGSKKIEKEVVHNINEPVLAGEKLADMILADGGDIILKEIYS